MSTPKFAETVQNKLNETTDSTNPINPQRTHTKKTNKKLQAGEEEAL
jgi:hypothetical protein